MNELQQQQLKSLLYHITRHMENRVGFNDVLADNYISPEEWPALKEHIEKTLDVKLYC